MTSSEAATTEEKGRLQTPAMPAQKGTMPVWTQAPSHEPPRRCLACLSCPPHPCDALRVVPGCA